jgi:Patatin-like phospholipase
MGGCKPKPPKIPSSWVSYQTTKNSKALPLLKNNLTGWTLVQNVADDLSFKNILPAAGYKLVPKTAAQQQKLKALPHDQVTMVQKDGKTYYVFPDACAESHLWSSGRQTTAVIADQGFEWEPTRILRKNLSFHCFCRRTMPRLRNDRRKTKPAMSKRLAITIAGAVSLGSYEAGVLYEILEALRQHNEFCEQNGKPDEKILVDVLTGASAGGMTAVIATQKLLFEESSLRDPENNSFYRPWVADVSLDELFRLRTGENPSQSVFSSNLIGEIADRHIMARYKSATPIRARHAAAADKIWLGLALSNLNGVTFQRSLRTGSAFNYSRFQDEWRDRFDSANAADDSAARWKPLRDAALSCGAFPVAFRLVSLPRTDANYQPRQFFVQFGSARFAYTDGGTFQNEPLGLAREFVRQIDKPEEAGNRFYLFVAPGALGPTTVSDFSADSSILKTLQRIAGAIFQQARFHDWIMAEDVNERIRRFDEKAEALKKDILVAKGDPRHVDWRSLQPTTDALLPVLYRHEQAVIETERKRLRALFADDIHEIAQKLGADGPAAAAVWLDAMLAFERAAELDDKEEMIIYGVTATREELASDLISAFGGFFEERFRRHDYLVGREKARAFLLSQAPGKAKQGDIGPIRYPNPPAIPVHENLGGVGIGALSKQQREKLRECLLERVSESLKELKVPAIAIPPLRWWVLRPMLNKQLGL